MIAYIPLLVAIAGLLLWVLAAHPKVARAGEILFFGGTLVTLFVLAGHTVRILPA